ncbi:uncharacterized protein LOC120358532, partial [Solenopsis invicta]|uniref:uncharacterized protein LOC120358532 n=1 Tax=Solenopsis invicta TaxID=13686 RepID=UPI00193DDE27
NPLDAACREHDIAYSQSKDLADRHAADNILAVSARKRITARDSTLGERAAAAAVWAAMRTKTKMGMGLKTKTRKKKKTTIKKRILQVAKRGGILPILPMLGTLGSFIGGAATVAKAVTQETGITASAPSNDGETTAPIQPAHRTVGRPDRPPIPVRVRDDLTVYVPYYAATISRVYKVRLANRRFTLRFSRDGQCHYMREFPA